MKTNGLYAAVALATGAFVSTNYAQTANTAPTVVPQTQAAPAPQPTQIVYSARLPSAQELTNVAAAQGLTVERIDQTLNSMTAIYKTSSGQITTVSYQLLPASGAPAQSAGFAAPATAVASAPTTIVYASPPTAVYYDNDPYYYGPWYAGYPRVAFGIGIGGGYRGGYRWHR